ncbi:MAG: NTP transferase domain-containing protein [Chloroflexi bacterium]|nr:NTP transferase domain-containing protein [Chloroflexota bacterium]
MQAIILAAGLGSRLHRFTHDRPKPLVEINGIPLLDYSLEPLLNIAEVHEVTIVTGYLGEQVADYVKHRYRDYCERIRFVHNDQYRKGSIVSISKALPRIDSRFIVLNADHIYHPGLLEKFVAASGPIIVGCDYDRCLADDDMKVLLSEGRLIDIDKQLTRYDTGYIGLTCIDQPLVPDYKRCVASALDEQGDRVAVERAVLEMSKCGLKAQVCDLSGIGWFEVDTPHDKTIAEQGVKAWKLDS